MRAKTEWSYNLLIAMLWSHTILLQFVRAAIRRVPIVGAYPDNVISSIYIILILLSIWQIKIYKQDFLFIFVILVVYFLSPLLNPKTTFLWEANVSSFVLYALPMYFAGTTMMESKERFEYIFKIMYYLSFLSIILGIIYQLTLGRVDFKYASSEVNQMTRAYDLLPHICLMYYFCLKKRNILNYVVAIIGSVYLLFLGCRGAIGVMLLSLIVFILFMIKGKKRVIVSISAAFLLVITVTGNRLEALLRFLSSTSESLGLSTRFFDKLLEGNLSYQSGRDEIADYLYKSLENSPTLGYGLYADRYLTDGYAHKFYLELWVDFGYIVGTVLLAIIIYLIIKVIIICPDDNQRAIIITFLGCGFIKLFLSGSYLTEAMFYWFIGIIVAVLRNHRMQKCIE